MKNKIALVTGASRGIGKAIAHALAEKGAIVIGTATSKASAKKITESLNGKGEGRVLNLADLASIEALVKEMDAPNMLINNAGITDDNLFLRMKDEQWQRVIDTNLTGVFRLTKACMKAMLKARWGRIINISSIVASSGNPGQANYCAAKAGLLGFTKSLALEIATRNITVNAVSPGFIETEMTDALTDQQREAIMTQIPMGRMGQPSEIADAVCFLASDQAAYITGQTLHVNGGMYTN